MNDVLKNPGGAKAPPGPLEINPDQYTIDSIIWTFCVNPHVAGITKTSTSTIKS